MSVDVPKLLEALGINGRDHGEEMWSACPDPQHQETRPSWSIKNLPYQRINGTHYCFGCQLTGGPVHLVMVVVGLSYLSAKNWITAKNLWLKGTLALAVKLEVTNKFATHGLRIPGGLVSGDLMQWASPVRKYALVRGLTAEQVDRWEICYAIDGAMAGRIVFPVKDTHARWMSWHARTFCDQDKRYKNASKADGFDQGAIFGMRHWPTIEERASACLTLTEGALDSLACERAGVQYIAAIGGSDPHTRQRLKLSGWGEILVATDGDDAGDKMFFDLRQTIGSRVNVSRVAIPRGTDAAELPERELKQLLCQGHIKSSQKTVTKNRVRNRVLSRGKVFSRVIT